MNLEKLFFDLYKAQTEKELKTIIAKNQIFSDKNNWLPLGGIDNNSGVIDNQQSSPIAALIEKITNSIDAILMRKCFENSIDPKSENAPKSIQDAVNKFFPGSDTWNLSSLRQEQALDLQILADGPKLKSSLIIYDNGEGQHPENFENTFLSILKSNKRKIPFVQGKFNMGGTGAIVYCGEENYQLIGSRRYDGNGMFGFTLVRKHPLSKDELAEDRNWWYEYFKIDNAIPSFEIKEMDLGLHKRKFITGTIIKLYSYDLPEGSRSVISRDLNMSINEYLFEPALPIYTIDKKERYPDDKNLERELYGLKRRLEQSESKYIEDYFSIREDDSELGTLDITCYVFKPKVDGKGVRESLKSIKREFFKNGMSVLFSLNGQVHGHYTYEFISRTLKMGLIKESLLIHVDCSKLDPKVRGQLFMASRDRLKGNKYGSQLRSKLGDILKKSRLKDLVRKRRQSLSVEGNTGELIKSFSKNIPKSHDLLKLLGRTLKLDTKSSKTKPNKGTSKKPSKTEKPIFKPKRFPTSFKFETKRKGIPVVKLPIGGEKVIKFSTDVEDHYFDRVEEPGNIKIGLLNYEPTPNESPGGTGPGTPKKIEALLNVRRSGPDKGQIKISLSPTKEIKVGDQIQVKVTLEAPGQDFESVFMVKVSEKSKPVSKKKSDDISPESLGLPGYQLVYRDQIEKFKTWSELEENGIEMDEYSIMHPLVSDDGETLETIFINMDSAVISNYRSKFKGLDQLEAADKKYITSVYFHLIFIYSISKKQKYRFQQNDKNMDLSDFLKDLFSNFYSEFILNFQMQNLMDSLED